MKSVLIVGCGNIGSKLYKEYERLKPDRYDPYKSIDEKKNIRYDFAFIAVDTPMLADGSCDLSQVETAIKDTNAEIIVLRSTVPPYTTQRLANKLNKKIVFSPEFYGTTQHCDENTFDFNFVILGGETQDCDAVAQLLQDVYDARFRVSIVDSPTAELAKYMENTMLAAKVSLCVQFYEIANQLGISYQKLRELWLMDKRFSRSHTFVYADHPFWESHCFDKDIPALLNFANAPLIAAIRDYNEDCKKKFMEGKENGSSSQGD